MEAQVQEREDVITIEAKDDIRFLESIIDKIRDR